MLSESDYNYNIKNLFVQLKCECYFMVKEYRKIIFNLNKKVIKLDSFFDDLINRFLNGNGVDSFCKIIDGRIGEDGKMYITQNIKDNFKKKIEEKCIQEIEYYMFLTTKYIDIFIDSLMNMKNPVEVLVLNNSSSLKFLYECWFGEIYDEKYFDAIQIYIRELQNMRNDLHKRIFDMLYLTTIEQ